MSIRIHDTLAGKTVPLRTRDEGRVTMYGCGPTVYNFAHIGNVRTFLWYDLTRRYLRYRGYSVTYVMNYTDVDDKTIERSRVEGLPLETVTNKYAAALEQDLRALGVEPPDILCRATDHIADMVEAIQGLIDRGVAYESEGDVWFAVEAFSGYGKLSGRTLDDMRAGERVEPSRTKRNPLDFALWKSAKEAEPSWPSPWGPGRPGWHIECSVMSTKYLGMGFDLHGGAADLIFPHHENEIAQAEALGKAPFVRHWIHSGLVQMQDEKMSKSLGNVALARDVLERYPAEVVRYWAVSGSYRTELSFSDASIGDASQAYGRLKTFFDASMHALGTEMPEAPVTPQRVESPTETSEAEAFVARFIGAMDDDLNSARGLGVIHELVRAANRRLEGAQRGDNDDRRELREFVSAFLEVTGVLGFHFATTATGSHLVGGLIELLLELREQARAEKSFGRADEIRARLRDLGVTLEDTPGGTRWRLEASSD